MSVWWEHKGSANRSKELPSHHVVIFLRGPEIPFARLTTCLLEKPEMVRHKKPPCRLLMHHFPPLARSLWNVPTHTALTFLFCRVFKLPRVLVKLWEGCFLFFLILCAFEVSGCPLLPNLCLYFLLHSPASEPNPSPACWEDTSGYTQCSRGAPLCFDKISIGPHSTLLPPFRFSCNQPPTANCDSFLMTSARPFVCASIHDLCYLFRLISHKLSFYVTLCPHLLSHSKSLKHLLPLHKQDRNH